MEFPNEVLLIIFKHCNSQTELYHCSLVCHQWYKVATATTFYTDITIYTLAQFSKYLETVTNNKPLGNYLRRLTLLFETKIKPECFSDLKQYCPFITAIQIPLIQLNVGNHEAFFNTLGHIATIKLLKDHDNTVIINYHINETTNNYNKDLTVHKISLARGNNNGVNFMGKSYNFYTDVYQQHLTELCLNFYYVTLPVNYVTLDTLHKKYPQLSKLTIIHLDLNHPNLSQDYRLRDTRFKKMRSFCLKSATVDHSFIFHYITKRYPKLRTLELLDIDCDSKTNMFIHLGNRVEEDLFNMFTTFVSSSTMRLKTFHLTFSNTVHWPNNRLMEYIHLQQQQLYLKSLTWPTTFMISKELLNSPLFSLHLQSFHFKISDTTWEIFKSYLNEKRNLPYQDKELVAPLSFPLQSLSLSLCHDSNKLNINLFDLMDLFPKLTTLKLDQLYLNATKGEDKINNQKYYLLQTLLITDCKLEMENILTNICHYCPQLEVLHCISSSIFYNLTSNIPKTISSSLPSSSKDINYECLLLDAPHIKLKELKIRNLTYYSTNNDRDDLLKYRYFNLNINMLPYLDQITKTFKFKYHDVQNHIHFYNRINLNTIKQFYYNNAWIIY